MVIFIHPFFLQGGDNSKIFSAGLPNIIGEIKNSNGSYAINAAGGYFAGFENNGCFAFDNATGISISTDTTSANILRTINFNAKQCNPIYGNAETVMPATIQLIPQIKY